jgi:photosystem II reaction center protein PsbM
MAPLTAPVVALLMLAGVQADDMADRSRLQGFLSQTSAGDYDKFITPNLKHMKHTASQHVPEEEKAAQKMLGNDSNMPVSLSAIGIGMVSLAAMLGFSLRGRIQRGLQSAATGDMSVPLFDNALELETQDMLRECKLLHGRTAMLAASWFSQKEDLKFDPLNGPAKKIGLKNKELNNARNAMIAMSGMVAQPAFAADFAADKAGFVSELPSQLLSLEVTESAFLAVILGTFVPCVFLISLYIQSEAALLGERVDEAP